MKITLAKQAGFCFGVDRAVETVYECLKQGKKTATLGPIIHNPQMVKLLEEQGVRIIHDVKEAVPAETVIIRSHGVGPDIYDELQNREQPYVDATCPFVGKIHSIVRKHSRQGDVVLIAGDKDHPEVIGITGYCKGEAVIFKNERELQNILDNSPDFREKPAILVAQTTFNMILWKKCKEFIRNYYTNVKTYDTICSATTLRQSEAAKLAQNSDMMVIIGGKSSSNTAKLCEICDKYCKTVAIEQADEIYGLDFKDARNVGVTAGASTPAHIIKEVFKTMDELVNNQNVESVDGAAKTEVNEGIETGENNQNEEMKFAELLQQSQTEKIYAGKRIKGIVTSISRNEVHVDVGAKGAGIIPASEISDDSSITPDKAVTVGEEIDVVVTKVDDREGLVMLSKKQNDAIAGFDKIKEALENDSVLEGIVTDVIRGGVLVLSNNFKVFVPASQTGISKDGDLTVLAKQNVKFKLIEITDRRRAIGSIRRAAQSEREKASAEFWAKAEMGQIFTGAVKSLTSYGAFVDLGGEDGMVHITELSWAKIKHPSDVISVGDMLTVYIKDIDAEKKRISLGFKKAEDNPWIKLESEYKVGDKATVKIVSITPFGAFAEIFPGADGLIHISEISHNRIAKVSDVLSTGQEVEAEIIGIDYINKKISLSMRALEQLPVQAEEIDDELVQAAQAAGVTLTVDEPAAEIAQETVEAAVEEVAEAAQEAVEAAVEETVEAAQEAIEATVEEADAEKPAEESGDNSPEEK